MRIIKKEPGEPYEIIDTDITSQFGFKSMIGGLPEFVYIENNLIYIVDEDFISKKLPFNFCILTNSKAYPINKFLGTVLLVRTEPVYKHGEHDDNRVVDLKPGDIERFEQTLAISELLPIPFYKGYEY